MAVRIRCLGDNLDTETTYSYWWKMTKTQRMGIRLMAVSTQQTNFGLRAEANCSHPQGLNNALQMGKSLETTSMQWIDFGLMVMSQQTTMPRVVAE